jgi:hypothetical protein
MWAVAGFILLTPEFTPRAVAVLFVVDNVTIRQNFPQVLWFSILSYHFTNTPLSFIHYPENGCEPIRNCCYMVDKQESCLHTRQTGTKITYKTTYSCFLQCHLRQEQNYQVTWEKSDEEKKSQHTVPASALSNITYPCIVLFKAQKAEYQTVTHKRQYEWLLLLLSVESRANMKDKYANFNRRTSFDISSCPH